jgi:hypothetical protein
MEQAIKRKRVLDMQRGITSTAYIPTCRPRLAGRLHRFGNKRQLALTVRLQEWVPPRVYDAASIIGQR